MEGNNYPCSASGARIPKALSNVSRGYSRIQT